MIPPKQHSMDERLYWAGFNLVKGIGAVRVQSGLDHFGDAKTAWDASPADLAEAGLGKKVLQRFIELRASLDLTRYFERREVLKVVQTDATEAALLEMLSQEPLQVDDIRLQIGLSIEKGSAAWTLMELKGMVRPVGWDELPRCPGSESRISGGRELSAQEDLIFVYNLH